MEDTSNSDTDFWDTFSEIPTLGPKPKKRSMAPPEPIESKPAITIKTLKERDIDKQSTLVQRIKDAGAEESRIEEIRVKNSTKKELYPAVRDIIYKFQQDKDSISKSTNMMKDDLLLLTREESWLIKKMCLQERLLSRHNLEEVEAKKKRKPPEESEVSKQIKIFSAQVSCLREVTAEFNKDYIQADQKLDKIRVEISNLKSVHEIQVSKIKTKYLTKEQAILEEIEKIKLDHEAFKIKSEEELDIREIIFKRQQDFIYKLQQELGNSKYIFNNPRLRQLLYAKLQGKVESPESLPASSYTKKRAGVSTRAPSAQIEDRISFSGSRPVTRDLRPIFSPRLSDIAEVFPFNPKPKHLRSQTPYS